MNRSRHQPQAGVLRVSELSSILELLKFMVQEEDFVLQREPGGADGAEGRSLGWFNVD